jgi:hypothetical protein
MQRPLQGIPKATLTLACPGLGPLLDAGYAAFREILREGAAGFGRPERALGADRPDPKQYLEFGPEERSDIPTALSELRQCLCSIVDEQSKVLAAALLGPGGTPIGRLPDRQTGPILRLSFYPGDRSGLVNHPHTDIDLFTLLPAATRPGLEVRNGTGWSPVTLGPSEVLVLPGELIRYFGGPPAVEHRVMGHGGERISASLFVNADPTLHVEGVGSLGALFEARLAAIRQAQDDAVPPSRTAASRRWTIRAWSRSTGSMPEPSSGRLRFSLPSTAKNMSRC